MRKEDLINLGVSEEAIAEILKINGLDVERERDKTLSVKNELATARLNLTNAQNEIAELKASPETVANIQQQLNELTEKYNTDVGELQRQIQERDYKDAVSKAISSANEGKGLKFSSKGAETAFIMALKEKGLELKDGAITGFEDFVKAQKEADPDAFMSDTPPARFAGKVGIGEKPPEVPANVAQAKAIGAQKAATANASNDVFNKYV